MQGSPDLQKELSHQIKLEGMYDAHFALLVLSTHVHGVLFARVEQTTVTTHFNFSSYWKMIFTS